MGDQVNGKGVYGGCKWRPGMRYTEVRKDLWLEGGLGQQGDNSGG